MDYGIDGRTALVCGSSRGIGKACAMALAQAGTLVFVNGRDRARLDATARDIAERTGAEVRPVVADINTDDGRAALLDACPQPDILVTNGGAPPYRDHRELVRADIQAGLEMNLLTPIDIIRAVLDGMAGRGFGRVVNITSVTVKMPIPGLDLSSAARAGFTAFIAGVARTVAEHNVTLNHILPGYVDTEHMQENMAEISARTGTSIEEIAHERAAQIPARRFARPEEIGMACAFLCSEHAGFITGQNLVIDGGHYNATF